MNELVFNSSLGALLLGLRLSSSKNLEKSAETWLIARILGVSVQRSGSARVQKIRARSISTLAPAAAATRMMLEANLIRLITDRLFSFN